MAVITISRQLGSLGCQIATEISNCLQYQVVWREVINQAAIRAGVPEVALATIDDLDLLGIRPSADSLNAYHQAVKELMHEYAHNGNVVIVGRAGQIILRGVDDVLHVRLYAPLVVRIERIALRHGVSHDTAKAQILASDQSRTRYLKKFYNTKWDDPELYDVMLNTANAAVSEVVSVVCTLISHRKK